MIRKLIAKLIVGAALMQTALTTFTGAQGVSCLGVPVAGAPIYQVQGNILQAFQNALGLFGL